MNARDPVGRVGQTPPIGRPWPTSPARPQHRPSPGRRATAAPPRARSPSLPALGNGTAARKREEAAKAVCAGCAVRVECRRSALAAREPYGVRGGLTAAERRALFTGDPSPSAA
ncbi:WhiB family transcriptional regulator [Kitasatospora cathayae]|uniref:WhiB family transcriptional regulator n=1 Tax=Kitasatospora cathayae TaxID=3004092 RepID=UPI0038602742